MMKSSEEKTLRRIAIERLARQAVKNTRRIEMKKPPTTEELILKQKAL